MRELIKGISVANTHRYACPGRWFLKTEEGNVLRDSSFQKKIKVLH